ncbi:hypothetical protein SELMODRAFT_428095 [Selaginella moellendorffii]|uniref:WW domain-containing protein n=1 Tax=Selaginella moellendorffii TaxID=88036 RepID=D8T1Q5_SELML|nr:hypothetical protein SELMODRAFT_428095 [Selaginella moellendorffii]
MASASFVIAAPLQCGVSPLLDCSGQRRRRISAFVRCCWKEVVDSSSGKPYYWNIKTNETRWNLPSFPEEPLTPVLAEEELTAILLAADTDKFGDIANNYRPQCFELSYFDYLTARIEASKDSESKLALERLRARLSNPLLKNPPPWA